MKDAGIEEGGGGASSPSCNTGRNRVDQGPISAHNRAAAAFTATKELGSRSANQGEERAVSRIISRSCETPLPRRQLTRRLSPSPSTRTTRPPGPAARRSSSSRTPTAFLTLLQSVSRVAGSTMSTCVTTSSTRAPGTRICNESSQCVARASTACPRACANEMSLHTSKYTC